MLNEMTLFSLLVTPVISLMLAYGSVELIKRLNHKWSIGRAS
ncbi:MULTISPECIES: hypothetical protein [Pseudoalteromonas]|uniref:Uncharacterized protein n=1 Tax=Pseudoalteromonas rubra TaxID=43658 RepID=A0A8T0C9C0_9GAMM|nr:MULTISPECIES: hypothetical protein [Pseudoalteromonas]KAF7786652.1 hypothetical protein PRUB_a1281 [Pseudoalteromonas rubra]MDK1311510.1 hypothetical protein [Pseudoalteromonas sp. R96]MEC4087447.1 hypothetical protein [Pseudoalteromonas rubra]